MMPDVLADRFGDLFTAANSFELLLTLNFLMHRWCNGEQRHGEQRHHRHHRDQRHAAIGTSRTITVCHRRLHHLLVSAAAGLRPAAHSAGCCPVSRECSGRVAPGNYYLAERTVRTSRCSEIPNAMAESERSRYPVRDGITVRDDGS